jgi:type I restriction enzyme S subunit
MSGVLPEWAFAAAGGDEGELPEGWTEAPLADLVVHATAGEWGRPDGLQEDGLVQVAVLRGADFRDWERDRGGSAARRRIPVRRLARLRLQAGDIVIETSGGSPRQPVGRTLLIGAVDLARADRPWICTNFCRLLRLTPEVDPAFVQMALAHLYHTGGFERFQTQTTNLRNLRFPDFLAGVVLPLPPIAEQRRIADRVPELLGRIVRLRSGLPRVGALLARERQALLTAAFTGRLSAEPTGGSDLAAGLAAAAEERGERYEQSCREARAAGQRKPRRPAFLSARPWRSPDPLRPPEVPAGWELRSLADLLVRVQQGTSRRAESGNRGGVAMLRMGNIQNGRLDWRDLKYLAPDAAAELAPFFLEPGDLLFNRTNSPELVGKAAVFDGEQPAVFASYLIRLTLDPRLVDSRWVAFWINSPWGRLWARAVRTEGVSQSNINAAQLLSLPVPLPPLALQR